MDESKTQSPQYTVIGQIAYRLAVPIIAGAVCLIAIPCVLFLLSALALVPTDWVTQEVSTRTLTVMFIVAAVVIYYFPAGRIADSAMHSLASRGWPLLQCPSAIDKSG